MCVLSLESVQGALGFLNLSLQPGAELANIQVFLNIRKKLLFAVQCSDILPKFYQKKTIKSIVIQRRNCVCPVTTLFIR